MTERMIDLKSDGALAAQCHLMPCRIECTKQTVRASDYFWPTIKELRTGGDQEQGRRANYREKQMIGEEQKENPIMTASFRGRPLQGKRISLPEGYTGFGVRQRSSKASGNDKKSKDVTQFKEFTYWNWDELPTDKDVIVKALRWINVAQAIHGEVSVTPRL